MRRVLPLLALLSLAFAPAPEPAPDTSVSDLKVMQGEWVRITSTIDGRPGDPNEPNRICIKGDTLTFPGLDHPGWKITLNTTKRPKHFNLAQIERVCGDKHFVGIYRLEPDRLTMCSRNSTKDAHRPSRFGEQEGNVFVEVYKRAK